MRYASLDVTSRIATAMPKNSNDRWKPAEDKRLLKMRADGKSNILIAAALRRSLSSVQGRIYLKKRAAGREQAAPVDRKRMKWSPADEQRLSEMNAAGASVFTTAMNRTEAAIENRIHVLKHRAGRPAGTALDRARER